MVSGVSRTHWKGERDWATGLTTLFLTVDAMWQSLQAPAAMTSLPPLTMCPWTKSKMSSSFLQWLCQILLEGSEVQGHPQLQSKLEARLNVSDSERWDKNKSYIQNQKWGKRLIILQYLKKDRWNGGHTE